MMGGHAGAAVIGGGVGGLHLLLRLAWADYYGRQHLGTIRGITLLISSDLVRAACNDRRRVSNSLMINTHMGPSSDEPT
jgi:hypothetical protein